MQFDTPSIAPQKANDDRIDFSLREGSILAKLVLYANELNLQQESRQVSVEKSRLPVGNEIWTWKIGYSMYNVVGLVIDWEETHANNTLFNPHNLRCTCTSNYSDWCGHKTATMIIASSNPIEVLSAFGTKLLYEHKTDQTLSAGAK